MYRVTTKRRNPASDPKTVAQVQAEQAFIAEHERLHDEVILVHGLEVDGEHPILADELNAGPGLFSKEAWDIAADAVLGSIFGRTMPDPSTVLTQEGGVVLDEPFAKPRSLREVMAQAKAEDAEVIPVAGVILDPVNAGLVGWDFIDTDPGEDVTLDPATHMSDEDWDELEEVMSRHAGEREQRWLEQEEHLAELKDLGLSEEDVDFERRRS